MKGKAGRPKKEPEQRKPEEDYGGMVLLNGINKSRILRNLNAERQKATIEGFRGHAIKSMEHEGRCAVWLEIARLADMRLKVSKAYVKTIEGIFLVDRYEWER